MLDVAISFLTEELNTYLLARTGSDFGQVQVSRIVDDSGKWASQINHIAAALVNVEEERVLKSQLPDANLVNGRYVMLQPELKLNLYLIFAAYFTNYEEALRLLSLVFTFFQARTQFTPELYPALHPRIEKLTAELQSLTFDQLNQVWTFIGAKQLPSAVYKIRMVTVQDLEPSAIEPPITRIATELHSR